MAGGSQPVKNDKPSIKYRCSPLDGAFIELANVECENFDLTSSESGTENSEISNPKSPDVLSTRELVSAIGHIWDYRIRPLSALLSKTSSRYNGSPSQNGQVNPSPTGEKACSSCSSAGDEYLSCRFPSNRDSSSTMPANFEYLTVTQKISLFEHSRRSYCAFWRLLQGRSDVPQDPGDGKVLGSIGIPHDLRKVYGWMNNVNLASSKHCVTSVEIENDKVGDYYVGDELVNPTDPFNSMDSSISATNVTLGNADCHTDVAQKVSPETIMQASNTTMQVEDDVKSLQSIDADTLVLSLRLQTQSNPNLSADAEEGKCQTDGILRDSKDYLPMETTEHNPEFELCVSSKGKANFMTANREHAFAGAMAGIFVSLCLHPVDTVKTVVQSCQANQNSLHHTGKSIVLERGITGLYRGISSNIASSAPISAIYTFTYESVKGALLPLFPKEYHSLAHCMAGGCASVATSFIFTPSERIKQQMQVGSHYQNCWIALIKIIEKGGLPSLYAGWGAVLCRNVPHSIIKFYTYESLKQLMVPRVQSSVQSNTLVTLVCGGLAGSTAAFFTTPFDVVKTRLQTQVPGSINQYNGVLGTLKDIGKREGLKGLYRGLTPRLFMYMTQGALFFASYESFKRLFSLEVPQPSAQKVRNRQRTDEDLTPLPSQEHD